jgi:hypothetical protein
MAKITKATLKSFVKKNRENLLINVKSSFNGMSDCVESTGDHGFHPAVAADNACPEHNMGIQGVWMVGGSGNYFTAYDKNGIVGIECYNCCGTFTVGIRK